MRSDLPNAHFFWAVGFQLLLFLLVHPGTAISLPVNGVDVRVRLLTGFGCGWISSWRPAEHRVQNAWTFSVLEQLSAATVKNLER